MSPAPQFASYIIHLIARVPAVENEFTRVALYDEIFDALAENPMLSGCVLSDSVAPVEDYLSFRPERFDELMRLTGEGRIDIGAWYVFHPFDTLELNIRNLLLGMETLRLLKMNVAAVPLPHPRPAFASASREGSYQIPQILRGFRISACVVDSVQARGLSPLFEEKFSIGLDGSATGIFQAYEAALWKTQREQFASTAAGRHLMAQITGKPADWLNAIHELRKILPKDDIFFSSRAGYTKAAMMNLPLPTNVQEIIDAHADAEGIPAIGNSPVEQLLLQRVEPLTVWTAYEGTVPLKNPQRMVQKLWRELLLNQERGLNPLSLEKQLENLLVLYPDTLPELFAVDNDNFEIFTIKLREDEQPGVVVRGYNRTGRQQMVRIKTWRRFSRCEVLYMDESRTGGQLAMNPDGSIQFTAHPHRILTLGLHD